MKPLKFTALILVLLFAALPAHAAQPKLNVVLIFIDDMGETDLGCYGSKNHRTPHLDKFAAENMRFTQAYSACTVCSPSRAALLTGKVPARTHITDWIAGHNVPYAKLKIPEWTQHLPLEEVTLAEVFKEHGYATACIGKWHLGEDAHAAVKNGFDLYLGSGNRGQPFSFISPYKMRDLADGPPGEYLTDRECDETLKFIEQNKEKPFFIYLPHHAVHTPITAKPELLDKFKTPVDPENQNNAAYATMVATVDDAFGRITAKLAELKLDEKTIVIFTSDNGGQLGPTSNLGMRAGKGSVYEGGVRIPLLVKWPGVTKPGVCATPVIHMDWFATLLPMLGAKAPDEKAVDGANIAPLLKQEAGFANRPLYWHYPHYHPGGATPYSAVRDGDFKLIEFFEDNHVELYNLKDDPLEKTDLAATQPEKAAALQKQLAAWRTSVGAQLPVANPNHDPARAKEKAPRKKE